MPAMTYAEMIEELNRAQGVAPVVAKSGVRSELPPHLEKVAASKQGQMISTLVRTLLPIIDDHVQARIADAVVPLRKRIRDLEDQPSPKWCGPHITGKTYRELSFCVSGGGLSVAERETSQRPGSDNSGWRLCVKRGNAHG